MFGLFRKRRQAADTAEFLRAAGEAEPELYRDMEFLRLCRERFGAAPRSYVATTGATRPLTLTPEVEALFVEADDALLKILADQEILLGRGQVVWGHLVQANQLLFDPKNPHTLSANVVYSTDFFFDGRTAILARIAQGLFAQKGSAHADPELRTFVRAVTDELTRILRRELPRGYCGGRSVYFATCFIQPGHLPGNCLTRPAFPLIVNFEETEAVMLLPSAFWPAQFVTDWRS